MGELYLSRDERDAIDAIDPRDLDARIEQCLHRGYMTAVRALPLGRCGLYVITRLQAYENAVADYAKAKAPKKRADTESRARRAGSDLAFAVRQMKDRLETERREEQLFYIDDLIPPPHRFSERLTVSVSYRWRPTVEAEWVHGRITFSHDADLRPDYIEPRPKRKPSAAKLERERQDKLYGIWDHLKQLSLWSVRDFFKQGGNAAEIPQSFQVRTDSYSRDLNNHSAKFWL
ncbi:hypothetical protein H0E84_03320 [Luteimonas sp. SJ-92]|uniref:Uncharacterized protein n=1 Tax=Luteimonas salinisoli TaxID=2752307 RepID=A0A853J8D6_9GAMM|nr:hypothetical protein [Luteimonas salinisoli]NZA25401.1 hypothetical protein [Luteimonas salinisoli]